MLNFIRKILGFIPRGIKGFLQNISDPHPKFDDVPEKILLGKSIEGRDIFAFKFGKGKRNILFISAIHGNEVGTIKLMDKFINDLKSDYQNFPDKTIFVVPILNPDGYFMAKKHPDYFFGGRIGRFNSNNVDLNRNFPAKSFSRYNHWRFGRKTISVCCGNGPLSEAETKALVNFIKTNNISTIYSFHNRGREVMGGVNELSQKLVADFVKNSGYKYVDDEKWKKLKQTGTLKEWCDENNIAYVEIEGASRYSSDYKNQKKALISAINYIYG